MRCLALALVLACGSPPPTPRAVAPPPPKPVATIASVSCGDAGVLLRGVVEDSKQAGPEKEAAIARACLRGNWTPEVLTCVGTSRAPRTCLDLLSGEQTNKYLALLATWNELFPDEQVVELDKPEAHPDPGPEIDCVTATVNVEELAPKLALQGADRRFAIELRRDAVEPICENWSRVVRACFADATGAQIEVCRGKLSAAEAKALADKLAESDALIAKIVALVGKPGKVDCAKAAAAYYSDAEWKARGPATVPKAAAVRRKMIADSRTLMKKACTTDSWPIHISACLVVGGRHVCFALMPSAVERWGFPAAGVSVKTGIPACETYAATLQKLGSCTKMPSRSIDIMRSQYGRESASYAVGTAAVRAAGAVRCKESEESIRRAAQAFNCTI
ncbi:MAG: hypothetical protein WKG01_20355 [Kofleriaceae bacterium]